MTSAMLWCLLLGSVSVTLAAPDFYSAWCPCKLADQCPLPYGSFFDDIALFGEVPPCRKFNFVRCCSSSDIPDGFNLERRPEYLPRPVAAQGSAESQQARLLAEVADDGLRLQDIQQRQDVIDFKAAQEKLKRDIANGIDNPNPPCGCYTSGTCPGRYATKSTNRDIGCLPGYETCCFLDDPWPNYQVTNLTINAPCSIEAACNRFFGRSPYDIAEFGPLEPCYLGQNRCLDYIGEGTGNTPTVIRPPVTQATTTTTRRPTTRRTTTRRATTTQRAFTTTTRPTTRYTTPTTTTETTTSRQPAISYYTTTRPVFTFRPVTSERPTPTTYRTSTQKQPEQPVEPLPSGGGSNNIIDIVTNGAYLPPSYDFGNAADRAEPANIQFALPF